MITKFL